MSTQEMVYDVCRHYLRDNRECISDVLFNKLDGAIRARDIKCLAGAFDLVEVHSLDLQTSRVLRQVAAFFKKNAAFVDDAVCTEAARASFFAAESHCSETNARLEALNVRPDESLDMGILLSRAERWIAKTLGPFDKFLGSLPELVRITPGATADLARRKSLPYLKVNSIRQGMTISRGAHLYAEPLTRWFGFTGLNARFTEVNRVEVVPKNWKTHRTIACEPTGNVPLQLAFDAYAKRMLKRRGIDLSNQDTNQELARWGSISDNWATVDLSAASDTVSYALVPRLFPFAWFEYLDRVRCSRFDSPTFGSGKYQKFSSMGNGSTFAIETLVFSACCHAVGSRNFSVYGDDIIIESCFVDELVRLLDFVGFTINSEKSYVSGPFRESCGADWFKGINITPFYLRDMDNRKTVWSHNVNGLAGIATPDGDLSRWLVRQVKERELLIVPYVLDTTKGVMVTPSTAYEMKLISAKTRPFRGISVFRGYTLKSKTRVSSGWQSLYLWYLESTRPGEPLGHNVPLKAYRPGNPWGSVSPKASSPEILGREDARFPRNPLESTRVPTLSHKFAKRWVVWHMPAKPVPIHLYWWSEMLDRVLRKQDTRQQS